MCYAGLQVNNTKIYAATGAVELAWDGVQFKVT